MKFVKFAFILGALFLCGGILAGMTVAYTAEELTQDQIMLTGFTTRYMIAGNEIMALQGNKNRERLSLRHTSDLKDAFVAIEDKRFYDHPGIDVKE